MDLAPELQPGKQPSALARFWAEALDEFEIRAYDDDEIARLASMGRTPETDPCLIVDGPSLEICFQEIDVPPMAKRPMHLDIATLIAKPKRSPGFPRRVDRPGVETHAWMRDPESNDFCLTDS